MNCIGIIAEYNPFHKGHEHQLKELAKRYPDALRLVVMSGSFVQRGEPALFDKFTRARWALLNGAHAVIELPTVYATANAERFAAGGVRLLHRLGARALAFGTETEDASLLQKIARLSLSSTVQTACREALKKGEFYGTALRQAIITECLDAAAIVNQPNALLGLEYTKAIHQYGLAMNIIPILREGEHHSDKLASNWPSGTALRRQIRNLDALTDFPSTDNVSPYISANLQGEYKESVESGAYSDLARYYDLVLYESRKQGAAQLEALADFKEGLHQIWTSVSQKASWPEAREQLKSKRYSYARLDRMASYTVLGITRELQNEAHTEGPQYARLLGFTDEARPWLQRKEFTVPLIQKWAPFINTASGLTAELAALDQRATDIQKLCLTNPIKRQGGEDFYFTPWYIKK